MAGFTDSFKRSLQTLASSFRHVTHLSAELPTPSPAPPSPPSPQPAKSSSSSNDVEPETPAEDELLQPEHLDELAPMSAHDYIGPDSLQKWNAMLKQEHPQLPALEIEPEPSPEPEIEQEPIMATNVVVAQPAAPETKLQKFEGFLKKAGSMALTGLEEVVKYVVPIAQVVAVADPATSPEVKAFTTSVSLVETAVLSAQQRWSSEGSAANAKKLADVLTTVEQPIILLFANAGLSVDTAYVTSLVNGVVAILNAQPGSVLPTAA